MALIATLAQRAARLIAWLSERTEMSVDILMEKTHLHHSQCGESMIFRLDKRELWNGVSDGIGFLCDVS